MEAAALCEQEALDLNEVMTDWPEVVAKGFWGYVARHQTSRNGSVGLRLRLHQ